MTPGVGAIVLAGGRSSRMGGSDKSLLRLRGDLIVSQVVARIRPQVQRLALNTNADPARFKFLGLPIIADASPDFPGPLAGILAGLAWARAQGLDSMVSVATDTPFFPGNLVDGLIASSETATIAMARCAARLHPVFALWPVAVAEPLAAFLASGEKASVLAFAERLGYTVADFEPVVSGHGTFDPFFNINTPADLAQAERIVATLP